MSPLWVSSQVRASDVIHGKGLKRNPKKFHAFVLSAPKHRMLAQAGATYPAKFDLSAIASLPRNQGSCGSCWAYSLTKALQSELMINGVAPSSLLDTGYLIGNCGGTVQEDGCSGGDFPAAANMIGGIGPWGNGVDPSSGRCLNQPVAGTGVSFTMINDENTPPTDLQFVDAMYAGKHVLSIDLAADDAWSGYPSGAKTIAGLQVFTGSGSTSIDHMINRVGYVCVTLDAAGNCAFDSNGMSAGIIYLDMNNWDETWGVQAPNGHGGYIYETRLANVSGQDAGYFTVAPNPTPPPPPPAPPGEDLPIWVIVCLAIGGLAVIFGIVEIAKK